MLENPIPPAMFVADPATLDWLNKERSLALAAENLAIPGSDHLYVQKVRLHISHECQYDFGTVDTNHLYV